MVESHQRERKLQVPRSRFLWRTWTDQQLYSQRRVRKTTEKERMLSNGWCSATDKSIMRRGEESYQDDTNETHKGSLVFRNRRTRRTRTNQHLYLPRKSRWPVEKDRMINSWQRLVQSLGTQARVSWVGGKKVANGTPEKWTCRRKTPSANGIVVMCMKSTKG